MNTRRTFLKTTIAGASGIALTNPLNAAKLLKIEKKRPLHVFTKCLQFLTYDEIAEILAIQGFDGADLTVRPGGQVLPKNVVTDLPRAIRALRNQGVGSDMITTAINNPDDQYTIPILRTMAELGIRYYRLGYLDYDKNKSIIQNLDDHKITFQKLEELNREYGVCGNYQNHSGTRIGGPVWDLHHLLKDCDPEFIGVQYDVRHAMVEGGESWPLGMKLLSKWIKTTDIKDFIWEKNEKGEWIIRNIPLGGGMVDFDKYFTLYESYNIEAPISIHYEYDLGGAEQGKMNPTLSHEEIFLWLKKDLSFLQNQLYKFNLE